MRVRIAIAIASALWLGGAPAATHAEPAAPSQAPPLPPTATMHQVFEALRVLLPLSLDAEQFRAEKNQPQIAARIAVLSGATQLLENHAAGRDRSFRFLSQALARDVSEIDHRYRFVAWKRRASSSWRQRATASPATRACRATATSRWPVRLLDGIDMTDLSHHERGQLFVATRQFEKALSAWEELFADPMVSGAQLDLGGSINDYLTIAVRVRQDYARARKGLDIVTARSDLPAYLVPRLRDWQAELEGFESRPPDWRDLDAARRLVDRKPGGGDSEDEALRATVSDLVASALLLRHLDDARGDGSREAELAEVYYLLGKVEARSVESFWVPQATQHLELAIRLDPAGRFAPEALRLYEAQLAFGYGGVESEILPVDLWTTLAELRRLVAEARS